ncbi:hypothetical protein NW837_13150 [Synechococcus sp. R6-10]
MATFGQQHLVPALKRPVPSIDLRKLNPETKRGSPAGIPSR